MKPEQRRVAGLWCGEVLARLSDYLDGALSAEEVERIEEHLRGCDWCERFGGDFAAVVAGLKEKLADPEPLPADVNERLWSRLRQS